VKVKKVLLIALCGASLLATQPAYTFSFGALISGVTAAWSVLPKRVLLIGALCLGVWKLVNKLCVPSVSEALCGQVCSICQEEFKSGEDIVTCKDVYGDRDGDKHGFHRACIYGSDGGLKCERCPVCRATKNPDAARDEANRLRAYAIGRDSRETEVELQEELDHAAPTAVPDATITGPLAHVVRPAGIAARIWDTAQNSLRATNGAQLTLVNVGLQMETLSYLLTAIPVAERARITALDVTQNPLNRLPMDIFSKLPHVTHVYVDRFTLVPAHDRAVTIHFVDSF